MPDVPLPPELKPVVNNFIKERRSFTASLDGKKTVASLDRFATASFQGGVAFPTIKESRSTASTVMAQINSLPPELVESDKAPLIDLKAMLPQEAAKTLTASLWTLAVGVDAMLTSGQESLKTTPDALIQLAFGADAASARLRGELVKKPPAWPDVPGMPGLPEIPGSGGISQADIDRLIRGGAMKEWMQTFARCGFAAQRDRDWVAAIKPLGKVTALSDNRVCAGDKLTISYAGFGAQMPANVADVIISIPTGSSCTHFRLSAIAPHLLQSGGWRDTGSVTVTLPAAVGPGCIGFFTLPPPVGINGCEGGSLVTAAGMMQSILGEQFGPAGVMIGQHMVNSATRAESAKFTSLPCAVCQSDKLNHIEAGPPKILYFKLVESGPIHPRGTVTLEWQVENADSVTIVPRSVAGSLNAHELPPVTGTLPLLGRKQLSIPCTRRWEGDYVLLAQNANGCTATPLESSVRLWSGFSEYRFGAWRTDITDNRPGKPMLGFSDSAQETSGAIDLRLYARAFVVEENNAAGSRGRIAMVVADIWGCSQLLKTKILERLNANTTKQHYSDETLIISGTHTHSGIAGHQEYFLYNLTAKGFDQQAFDTLVSGIAMAVRQAETQMGPGRIFVNSGNLSGVGANRSYEAHKLNANFVPARPDLWIDQEMLLLKFVHDTDNRGGTRDHAVLNWHAIHPTNLGMFNQEISGDNKGWAEDKFEERLGGNTRNFVAAFGNAAAGDVSGNMTIDVRGRKRGSYPAGGPSDARALAADKARMMDSAKKQFDHAFKLFNGATEEVSGPLISRHKFVDMSDVQINAIPGARTWPAAVGYAFGGGSAEDSLARFRLNDYPPSPMIPSNMEEGFNQASYLASTIIMATTVLIPLATALPVLIPVLPAILLGTPIEIIAGTAIATVVPIAGAAGASAVAQRVQLSGDVASDLLTVGMSILPQPIRTYVAGLVGGLMFPGKLNPDEGEPAAIWKTENLPANMQGEGTLSLSVPCSFGVPASMAAGHEEKPIMFAVGLAELVFTPKNATAGGPVRTPCPLVPHVLPMQLIRIGQVALAGVPAEFNAEAGRRLKSTVRGALGPAVKHAAIYGYANAYSGYVATREEYAAQHYEGASTLYGPHTLAAYQQIFEEMAIAMNNGTHAGGILRFDVPAIRLQPL